MPGCCWGRERDRPPSRRRWRDVISAGQLLGYMGDTGYGKEEGTSGQFPVHLHVGIYVRTEEIPELAVNPYWFLRYLEQHKLKYSFS